jgi:O-Antigen ligase
VSSIAQRPSTLSNKALPWLLALSGGLLAASVFYTPLALALVVVVPCSIYFISRPYEMLLLMVFLIPFNFVVLIGPVPVAVELLKIVLWVPFLLQRGRSATGFKLSRYNACFGVLLGLTALSLFRSNDLAFTLKEAVRFGSNLGLYYMVLNLVDSREKVLQIFRILIISVFLVACYGFYQFAIGDFGALFWIVNPRLDTGMAHYRDVFWPWRNRLISVMTSEMEIAHYFNLCLPISVVLWATARHRVVKSRFFIAGFVIFVALLLTFTFGAWLALAMTAVGFLLVFERRARRPILFAGAMAGGLVYLILAIGPFRDMVVGKFLGTDTGGFVWDLFTRVGMWVFAVKTWWAHPLIGVGIGNYEYLSASTDFVLGAKSMGTSPHQVFLYLLVLFGVVGLSSVLVIVLGNIRRDFRLRAHPTLGLIAWALSFGLVANLLGWCSDDSGFFGPHCGYLLWLLLGLSEAVQNLAGTQVDPKALAA